MREIIFRAQARDGSWHYGDLITNFGRDDLVGIRETHTLLKDKFLCLAETVGQYMGLLDSAERKIFEGDILRFDYVGKNQGVEGVATVVFQNGRFGVLWGHRSDLISLDGFASTKFTVIGNIYDNPERLEVSDNVDEPAMP